MDSESRDQPAAKEQKASSPATNYQAYMLRIWQEDEELPWRASLQNPHTGEQHHFATLSHLFAFLEAQTNEKKSSA